MKNIFATVVLAAYLYAPMIIPDNSLGGNIHFGKPCGPNKIPVLNINAPNANGVSINKFHKYDVDERGLIVNNSAPGSDSISTLCGERLEPNPNFGTGNAARQILIEVNPT